MKSIELTEDHKSKLLEMCKKLFPNEEFNFGDFYSSECGGEYYGLDYLDVTHTNHKIPYKKYSSSEPNGFVNNTKQGCFEMNYETNNVQQGGSYCEVYVEGIHWFEFCMTHLARKVCKSDGITLTFKDDNNNIVDFLYEQFKKLK